METPQPQPQHSAQAQPLKLSYESSPPRRRPPAWVYVVVCVYILLLLLVLATPLVFLADEREGLFWVTLLDIALFAGGGLLVVVPIQTRRQRIIQRGSIVFPLLGAVILAGILCFGIAIASSELRKWNDAFFFEAFSVLWAIWAALLWILTRSLDPLAMSARLYKLILAGSVLEMLVAVPMHLVVRRRTECCAGIMTGLAICLGILTALVAIGPGMFFLFHRRWKEKYRQSE